MQILLKNGGSTPEYECKFKYTTIISIPDGKTFLKLSDDDLSDALRVNLVLEYEAELEDRQHKELEFYLDVSDDLRLYAYNPANSKKVGRKVYLTQGELLAIKIMTCIE